MKLIPVTKGRHAIVDDADYPYLSQFKWYASVYGASRYSHYTFSKKTGKKMSVVVGMYRDLLNPGPGVHVDHINGNRLDNRRANLRLCTQAQNARNRGFQKHSPFGTTKGVFRHRDKFTARIGVNRKSIYLGVFDTIKEAQEAYDRAAVKHHGVFASPSETIMERAA